MDRQEKKNTNLTGGVWLASQDLARLLDPTSRPYLPSVINSLSSAHVLDLQLPYRGLNCTDPMLPPLWLWLLSRTLPETSACHEATHGRGVPTRGQANGSAKILGSSTTVGTPYLLPIDSPSISGERRRDEGRFPNTAIKLLHPSS